MESQSGQAFGVVELYLPYLFSLESFVGMLHTWSFWFMGLFRLEKIMPNNSIELLATMSSGLWVCLGWRK
jgi:hypothetical protein